MYGTITAWRAYATARGNDAPASATDPVATAALTRASDYIRLRYVARFLVSEATATTEIEEAAYIAASYELAKPDFFSATFVPAGAKVLTEVKGIKWTPLEGAMATPDSFWPVSPAIDALLLPFSGAGIPAALVA